MATKNPFYMPTSAATIKTTYNPTYLAWKQAQADAMKADPKTWGVGYQAPQTIPYYGFVGDGTTPNPAVSSAVSGYTAPYSTGSSSGAPSLDDLLAGIYNNPLYLAQKAQLAALDSADLQNMIGQGRRAAIDFGYIPTDLKDPYGIFDTQTRQLAQENTDSGVSAYARLQKQYQDRQRKLKQNLAARGMLRSGEMTWGANEEELLNRQNVADATSKFQDYMTNAYRTYAQGQMDRLNSENSMLESLAQLLSQYQWNSQAVPYVAPAGGDAAKAAALGWGPTYPGATAPDYFANLAKVGKDNLIKWANQRNGVGAIGAGIAAGVLPGVGR